MGCGPFRAGAQPLDNRVVHRFHRPGDGAVIEYPRGMKQTDDFSDYYQELLERRYDSPDRIVFNGYFSPMTVSMASGR